MGKKWLSTPLHLVIQAKKDGKFFKTSFLVVKAYFENLHFPKNITLFCLSFSLLSVCNLSMFLAEAGKKGCLLIFNLYSSILQKWKGNDLKAFNPKEIREQIKLV